MVVPIDYVVSPEDTRYPQMCRGCHLGRVVRDIKAGYRLRQHREDLAAMGFTFQSKTQLRIEKTMEAITLYKSMYGHVDVPKQYMVPIQSEQFPEHLWGFKLGHILDNIKHRDTFLEYRDQFVALGLPIRNSEKEKKMIVNATVSDVTTAATATAVPDVKPSTSTQETETVVEVQKEKELKKGKGKKAKELQTPVASPVVVAVVKEEVKEKPFLDTIAKKGKKASTQTQVAVKQVAPVHKEEKKKVEDIPLAPTKKSRVKKAKAEEEVIIPEERKGRSRRRAIVDAIALTREKFNSY